MAQLQPVFLLFTTLVLLISCHHVSSSLSITSTSTIPILVELNNVTDLHALLSFKSTLSNDTRESLAFWNDSIHFCQWPGITCSGHRHPQRVVSLNLSSFNLAGFISLAITNLTFLKKMDLSDNNFRGIIPQQIGRLFQLRHLNLSFNSLEGGIPASLSQCLKLEVINLRNNMIQGEVPPDLNRCLGLQIINLRNNSLTGPIPPSLTNLSSLSILSVALNQLSGGIPPLLGKLSKLTKLYLSFNNFTGTIPASLWNLSSLSILDLSDNNLFGLLPSNAGQSFQLLEQIGLNDNKFHGPIPISFFNASRLENIYLAKNSFSGTIPPKLGHLHNLQRMILYGNQLEVRESDGLSFLATLTNCTNLRTLQLDFNKFAGVLPSSIANFSTNLHILTMGDNIISGSIPPGIGNLVSLTVLDMGPNILSGSIPASIGMLQKLGILDLSNNELSGRISSAFGNFTEMHYLYLDTNKLIGEISPTLGNLAQLNYLYLDTNSLSGTIPANLGNCQNLIDLNLGFNKLTGGIPKEILTISTLTLGLGLEYNSLTGPVPSEVGSLRNLQRIDLSKNLLSGKIPNSLGECQVLQSLNLEGNFFEGSIPTSFSKLKGLRYLDLSQNNLSGRIPDFFQDFNFLFRLNLSFNNLEGEVPRHGVFANTSAISVLANNKLCGGNSILHLPPCSSQPFGKKHTSAALIVIISVASTFLFLFLLLIVVVSCCWIKRSRKESIALTFVKEQYSRISYAELARATNGFSTENLIGVGSFGAVYKGFLDDEITGVVAVKVLNLQQRGSLKSFMTECDTLKSIRHRNLVRILTACSSIDFSGNDFKAIVFEFMANGNLDNWLHPANEQHEPKKLNLLQRMNIAIDVASALDYLHHHHGKTAVVHCDIKPTNILLSDDMTGHVGDFGLARFLKKDSNMFLLNSTNSTGLKGTIGYVAPEYGVANRASTKGDVYSYGILVLEMFTGKRPTDHTFTNGMSLRKYAEIEFPEQVLDVMDSSLLIREDNEVNDDPQIMDTPGTLKCVASLLRIGLLCSNELPGDRPEMGDIIKELQIVRDIFLECGIKMRDDKAQLFINEKPTEGEGSSTVVYQL